MVAASLTTLRTIRKQPISTAFQWRVSIAEVASDGPFSIFSGVDRSMAILQGDGLELEIDGVGSLLLRMNKEPRSFPADVATDARLLSGPILDLNAMSRRGCFNHSLQRIDVTDDYTIKTQHHALLVWCAGTGKIGCNMGTIAAKRYDAFLAQEPVTWQIRADANGQVLLMEFMAAA